jgi:membrane protein
MVLGKKIHDLAGRSPLPVRIVYDALVAFLATHSSIRASALTYTTALAVVPLVILLTSISMALGMASALTDYLPMLNELYNQNLPLEHILPLLQNAQKINFGTLGLIGTGGLLFTFIMGMDTIETNINIVWGIYSTRSWLRKILIYIPMLLVLGIFIGTFAGVLNYAHEILETLFVKKIALFGTHFGELLVNGGLWGGLVGLVLSAFWLLYFFVPCTKVRWWPSLIAAVFTVLAVGAFSFAMVYLQVSMFTRFNLFYGSLSFLPLVLFHIYGVWAITLFGNALCWRIQNYKVKDPLLEDHPEIKNF